MKSSFDPDSQNSSNEHKLVAALERISQVFRVLLWKESKKYSLSPIQIQVLIFLLFHDENKRKITYLANEFNMTKATVSDSVKVLAEKGLLRREYETADSRSYRIHLTAEGEKLARQTSDFASEIINPIRSLADEDQMVLLKSLLTIIEQLNKAGVITIPRMCFSCAHYRRQYEGHEHHCMLMGKQLAIPELRVDCPEHKKRPD